MLKGNSIEQKIWNYFKDKGWNDFGVAGLMGNLYAESSLNPENLQNSFENKLNHNDKSYTKAVNDGTYRNFVEDGAGYGLAQWTYWTRKQTLLAFAKAREVSIGDLELQLDYLDYELGTGYKEVLSVVKNAYSIEIASNVILINFEKPANQSLQVQKKRIEYGKMFYDKYHKRESVNSMAIVKDNTPDIWAKEAVDWAIKNKILFGDETGNYKLRSNCTRQEIIVMLHRYFKNIK